MVARSVGGLYLLPAVNEVGVGSVGGCRFLPFYLSLARFKLLLPDLANTSLLGPRYACGK
jgi:hypothetical protein